MAQWLEWQQQLHPRSIELGLGRVRQVFARLALDTDTPHIVSIAGTNGKGTCAHALQTFARAAGLRVGCYTSPHLWHYNERIRINGLAVDDASIVSAFESIEDCRGDISLSYFEFGTLAALYLFAQAKLDVWVLEVGLGGRLDAVNVVDADVAMVTSIALDHQAWLGDDLNIIAQEKAGIARAKKPLLLGPNIPQSASQYAEQIGAQVQTWSQARAETALPTDAVAAGLIASNVQLAALAFAALPLARDAALFIDNAGSLSLPGRRQRINRHGIDEIHDVAHNPQATTSLAEYLKQLKPISPIVAVFSVLDDKAVDAMVLPLLPVVDIWCIAPLQDVRAMATEPMQRALSAARDVRTFCTIEQALSDARQMAGFVVVCGSFLTVAAAGQAEHG